MEMSGLDDLAWDWDKRRTLACRNWVLGFLKVGECFSLLTNDKLLKDSLPRFKYYQARLTHVFPTKFCLGMTVYQSIKLNLNNSCESG